MLSRFIIPLDVGWLALLILAQGQCEGLKIRDRRGRTNSHVFLYPILFMPNWGAEGSSIKVIMGIFGQIQRTILLVLLSLLPFGVLAQASMDELLDGYVSASVNKESTTPYTTKINQMFKTYSQNQQAALRTKIYNRVVGDTIINENRLKGKFALIDLYALLADSKDRKLDDLYFKKGEICALHTGDTIMLKECITSLKLSDHSKTAVVSGYVNTLQSYLEEIRNYLPLSERIDGVWVSDWMYDTNWSFLAIRSTPMFVLNINHGTIKLENVGVAALLTDISVWSDNWSNKGGKIIIKNDEQTYVQDVVGIGKDKVYMVWSNEKLNIPNQAVARSLGQTTGDITTELTRKATSDVLGNIGGDIVGGIAGDIIGGAVMDLFAPSKKIYVLEMELEQVNEDELKGHFCWQIIKIDGNGKKDVSKEEGKVVFVRYDAESGVYFGGSGNMYNKYIPGVGISREFPAQNNQMFKDLAEKYQKRLNALKKIGVTYPKFQSYFAPLQIKKLIYYTEYKLLKQGYTRDILHFGRQVATMGVILENNTGKKVTLPKDMKGVYVYDVVKDDHWHAPAFLFGIKQGDIILSVDGYEMNSPEQLYRYIRSLKPYDWVTVHIKRYGEEKDIEEEGN